MSLILRAYWQLIRFNFLITTCDFARVYREVRDAPLKPLRDSSVETVCRAVDIASIWFWKEVRCLQRSAATTYMLRNSGVPARLVLGVQPLPFKAHAWVEVEGFIVNDKPQVAERYAIIDRC